MVRVANLENEKKLKIYKYKDLTDEEKHVHFYQIVLDNTIWCARPDSLNDNNEFNFEIDYRQSPDTAKLLYQVITKKGHQSFLTSKNLEGIELEKIAAPIVESIIENCRETIGVTSFSITNTDDYLWHEYGGKANGVCVEINIPDELVDKLYHHVHYVSEKIFHIDTLLKSSLSQDGAFEVYRNILLTKTKQWSQEQEVRFIGKNQKVNFKIDGYISEVTFGSQVPAHTFKQVLAKIVNHCSKNNIRITRKNMA